MCDHLRPDRPVRGSSGFGTASEIEGHRRRETAWRDVRVRKQDVTSLGTGSRAYSAAASVPTHAIDDHPAHPRCRPHAIVSARYEHQRTRRAFHRHRRAFDRCRIVEADIVNRRAPTGRVRRCRSDAAGYGTKGRGVSGKAPTRSVHAAPRTEVDARPDDATRCGGDDWTDDRETSPPRAGPV